MKEHEGSGTQGDDEPKGPESKPARPRRSHARALVISSALVVICFLVHIFILFMIDPTTVQNFSKLNTYALGSIPLAMGLVFFFDAITHFRKIEARSPVHLVPLLFAVVFGGLSIQGLLGFMIYLVRHTVLM